MAVPHLAPLFADKLEDRSAYNIFLGGYGSAIATVSSQTNAHSCMGSILTRQYAMAMAAGPELMVSLDWALRALTKLDPESVACDQYQKGVAALLKAEAV